MYGVIVVPTTATISSRIDGAERQRRGHERAGDRPPVGVGEHGRRDVGRRRRARRTGRPARRSGRTRTARAPRSPTATIGTTMIRGIPKISRAADAPANSATVLATLAMSRTTIAKTVQRTPNRSRMRSDRPWPVTTPSRATISWTTARMTIVIGKIHSSVRPGPRAEDRVGRDAAGVVAGDPGDEPGAHDRQEREDALAAAEAAAQAQELALLDPVAEAGQRSRRSAAGRRAAGRGRPGPRHCARRRSPVRATPLTEGSSGMVRRPSRAHRSSLRPRAKGRGRRRFRDVGRTVSIASSTVTMPASRPSSSMTGTASRL